MRWRYQGEKEYERPNEYSHLTWCFNCSNRIYVYIKKGVPIDKVQHEFECDKCGCKQPKRKK